MKKIIDGKRYNTETAEEIANYENTWNCQDFGYYSETLYKTKKGAYFLYGEGMCRSKYGTGHGFTPLTDNETFKWLCEYGFNEEAEEEFSEMIEEA
jgi:hypothetical protein